MSKHAAEPTPETLQAEVEAYNSGPWTKRAGLIARILNGRARYRAGNFTTKETS